jgi:flagellar biosynthesis GTPase FlhF
MSPVWHGRWVIVSIAGLAIAAIAGCDKPKDRTQEQAAIAAAIEQARRDDEEADRQMRERAAEEELARREAEQAEIDARVAQEEGRKAIVARLEQRLRGVLIEPASMQIRNQRLNGAGTALCAEFSGKNKQGVYVGFRRVVVSDTVISFDQDPDDTYREPRHRYPAIASANGC